MDQLNRNDVIKNVVLEITLECNLTCANCNRLVGISTPENSFMTIDQIDLFIQQTISRGRKLDHIWIMGGEPLIHPKFLEIYKRLKERLLGSYVEEIILVTTGTLPIPKEVDKIDVGFGDRLEFPKEHVNILKSPKDLGYDDIKNCNSSIECGIVVNAFGYFPCGTGCSLIRLFNYQEEIQYDFPVTLSLWDFNKICPHCAHSSLSSGILRTNDQQTYPVSKTFEEALIKPPMILRLFGNEIIKENKIRLKNLNDTNGASTIVLDYAKRCLAEFNSNLIGCEMGVAYGGGVEAIGKLWKDRGIVYGFDTFEGHPKQVAAECEYSKQVGGINSFAANCMDYWYNTNNKEYGTTRLGLDYIQSELDASNITNVILVKGLITENTNIDFINELHYAFLDLDIPLSMKNGYELIKNKIVKGGYLCLHDCIPNGHIFGCYEIYQEILKENLFEIEKEIPESYLVILKKK